MKRKLARVFAVVAAIALGFLVGGGLRSLRFGAESASEARSATGKPAPELVFELLDGSGSAQLSDFRGRAVLLNFWATWCPPCRAELPALNRLQRELAPQGLLVLAISDEDPEQLRRFMAELPEQAIRYGFLGRIPEVAPFNLALRYRPVTVVVDPEGVVREVILGAQSLEAFRQKVAPYLPRRAS
ncbi:MAG: TlpA family protein disulfide reductase [Bacteroidetes bacterium]|nr:TlpA family protein disulfide reductase [Rhodothermia bacterium]MCS7155511.1 TlpA family protein disulfide reductase [Bacteroidota bacterium]MCX7907396.1 TlpA family protein disulfide reductase [Bacteroidota bacterium]MDW8138390.1 TlpA disulfide reductase family protein [Bacteroidota bacterium]MDW8284673.1 TlpA disulfide reductase family protein [Bacteroidota bacterium]